MQDKITFVCCIEHGNLETQTILMLKTFRKYAGNLKNSRFIAVMGRFGANLRPSTLDELKKLSVELVYDNQINPVKWLNYSNKIVAVQIAQKLATTELIAWIDSDTLFAHSPDELLLDDGIDFAARGEFLPPAVQVHLNNTEFVPYWKKLCEILDTRYELLPNIVLDDRDKIIKLYFNSGIFVWRKSSKFAELYYDSFIKVMKSKIAQHDGNFFTADQIILGPIVIKSGMHWKQLSYKTHHMIFQFQISGPIASPNMSKSSIIHYSKALSPNYRAQFLDRLKKELPELHQFVTDYLSTPQNQASCSQQLLNFTLRVIRGLRWKLYALQVQKIAKG